MALLLERRASGAAVLDDVPDPHANQRAQAVGRVVEAVQRVERTRVQRLGGISRQILRSSASLPPK